MDWWSGSSPGAERLLVLFGYRPHANDRRSAAFNVATTRFSYRVALVGCVAEMIWGLATGAFETALGFAPLLMISDGASVGRAGLLVAVTAWLIVLLGTISGIPAQR